MQGISMSRVILDNMFHYFQMYEKEVCIVGVFVLVSVLIVEVKCVRKHGDGRFRQMFIRALVSALLAAYLYLVIGITLLSRRESSSSIVNLKLFDTFGPSFGERMFVYENILLFVPFGILFYILAVPFRKMFVSLMAGFGISLLIETTQFFTHLGRFEVDDLLTNTCGMMLGYCICKAFLLPSVLYH